MASNKMKKFVNANHRQAEDAMCTAPKLRENHMLLVRVGIHAMQRIPRTRMDTEWSGCLASPPSHA